jgi:hypothetical protein
MSATASRPDRQHLRKFGFTVTIGFTAIGAISWWRGHTVAPTVLWTLAGLNLVPALVAPMLLGPVERVWMTVGNWLGWLNTRIILTVIFYVVVTPAGVIVRIFRDPLDREILEARPSYWIRRPSEPFDPKSYQRQF